MSVQSNLLSVRSQLPPQVKLVCVSKFHPAVAIEEAYRAGERCFGESKVQEMCQKYESLPKDIEWHFIGHLQTNKVKYVVPVVSLVHGVDSYKLLQEINKQAKKIGRVVNCLLQVHIAAEETKFGFSAEELIEMLSGSTLMGMDNIRICGLMGMATFTDNNQQIHREFKQLSVLFQKVKAEYFAGNEEFTQLSMGMSDDFRIAVEEGSTLVRIGSLIFGNRQY
ncbi:MAG TPA: YggS family pyridoxal phosphate-dependent enzyme [Paludibacter sp.]|nr:YggS family pyridoxal phosphate-dependent enzyme [Paludibacter sp.]